MIDRAGAETILLQSPWFARQSAGLRTALLARARIETLAPGQWIYGSGDALNGLYAVLAGTAHLTMTLGEADTLIEIVQPGQLFGQAARFGGGPRLVTAIAGERTTLLHVPDHVLAEIARGEPEVWRSFTELLYGQLAGALQLAAAMIRLAPPQRVAARLWMLAGGRERTVRVTQGQLAEMTGLSRKTVNGHLRCSGRHRHRAAGLSRDRHPRSPPPHCAGTHALDGRRVHRVALGEIGVEHRTDDADRRARFMRHRYARAVAHHQALIGQRCQKGEFMGEVRGVSPIGCGNRIEIDFEIAHQPLDDRAAQTVVIA